MPDHRSQLGGKSDGTLVLILIKSFWLCDFKTWKLKKKHFNCFHTRKISLSEAEWMNGYNICNILEYPKVGCIMTDKCSNSCCNNISVFNNGEKPGKN
jgi:hypothetical protein